MGKTAVSKQHMREKHLSCPRDKSAMMESVEREATLDVCGKCGGQFFDSGEMFKAFGLKADPSYWDRPETGGVVTDGKLECPVCASHMLVQAVKHEAENVEIDRCGHCGGIWLDKGEVERIVAIGAKIAPIIAAETAKAKAELDAMGDTPFGSPGLIARFLGLFSKKKS